MRTSQYVAPAAVAACSAASANDFLRATSMPPTNSSAAITRPNGPARPRPARPMPDIVRNVRLSTVLTPRVGPRDPREAREKETPAQPHRLWATRSGAVK